MDETVESITQEARSKNPDTSHFTKSSRLKGIRDNCTEAVAEHRKNAPNLIDGAPKKTNDDNVVYLNSQKTVSYDIPDMVDDLFGEDE